MMKRFLFEYEIISTGEKSELSVIAKDEKEAKELIKDRAADFNFVEVEDVKVGKMIKVLDAGDSYFECEGCT